MVLFRLSEDCVSLSFQGRPRLFRSTSDINHILKLVESYLNKQYDYIICLFDMDRLYQYPSEMQLYQRAKKEYSKKKYAGKVMFVETNPMYGILVLDSFFA